MNRLLSVEQAAQYLSLSTDTIYEYVRSGIIHRVKLPALPNRQSYFLDKILIDRYDLDRLITNGKPIQTREVVLDSVLPKGSGAIQRKANGVSGTTTHHRPRRGKGKEGGKRADQARERWEVTLRNAAGGFGE